jgi:hypothetical protein
MAQLETMYQLVRRPDLLDRRADALRLAVARRIASVGLLMRWPGLPLRWQRAVGASLLPSCGPTLTPDGVARRPRLARSQLVAER